MYDELVKRAAAEDDLEETRLGEYRRLVPRWRDCNVVKRAGAKHATSLFDRLSERR